MLAAGPDVDDHAHILLRNAEFHDLAATRRTGPLRGVLLADLLAARDVKPCAKVITFAGGARGGHARFFNGLFPLHRGAVIHHVVVVAVQLRPGLGPRHSRRRRCRRGFGCSVRSAGLLFEERLVRADGRELMPGRLARAWRGDLYPILPALRAWVVAEIGVRELAVLQVIDARLSRLVATGLRFVAQHAEVAFLAARQASPHAGGVTAALYRVKMLDQFPVADVVTE